MNKELQDYTATELVAEIKSRIANNSIEIPALTNLFIICLVDARDIVNKHSNLPQRIVDELAEELAKIEKLKKTNQIIMTKYEQLINKIRTIKLSSELEGNPYPNYNAGVLSPAELELITEALEFTQFLEIIFKERLSKKKLENNQKNSG